MTGVETLCAFIVIEHGQIDFGCPFSTCCINRPAHKFLCHSPSVPRPKDVDLLQLHRPWLRRRGGRYQGREFGVADRLVVDGCHSPANGRIGEVALHLASRPIGFIQELHEWSRIIQVSKSVGERLTCHQAECRGKSFGRAKEVDTLVIPITTFSYHKSPIDYSRSVAEPAEASMLFSSRDSPGTLSSILSGEGLYEMEHGDRGSHFLYSACN
jgi:hypothetical protein